MLHLRTDGNRVFSAAIYNRSVRECRGEKKKKGLIGEQWATIQLRDVVARDEREARRVIAERFPLELGFVVEAIRMSEE